MTAPDTLTYYYITVKPGEINGYLQAQEGKINIILGNYTQVFEQPPTIIDSSLQVFAVKIRADDIRTISDGGVIKTFLWRGDKTSRVKPQDKITIEVFTIAEMAEVVPAAPVDITAAARAAFGEYPAEVQLGLIINAQTVEDLTKLPTISPAQATAISNWAQATVGEFVASQASAATPAAASAAG